MGCGCGKKNTAGSTKIDSKKGFVVEPTKDLSISPPIITREDKKKEPSILTKALSLGAAVANHVADGMSKCSKVELAQRLEICEKCPERKDTTCTKCGCLLTVKAGWKTASCPMDKWPELVTE
mgnify:CR=1 FL=1|tara:strand:- start:292 stop:660 length:369 start_codon:yes stop_codon:yes gene_type:complete